MRAIYHFCRKDKKLGFNDGRHIKTGQLLKYKGPLEMCQSGLHVSPTIYDALQYAPGPVLCKVKLGGKIIKGVDKNVASERTVISMRNVSAELHEFACLCAERALKQAKVTDRRCWNAIKTKRLWLKGKASDKELAAARAAAWDAAQAAAWDAAGDAVWAAAWAAARDVAWDVAWDAAGDAAWDAEIRWQRRILNKLLKG